MHRKYCPFYQVYFPITSRLFPSLFIFVYLVYIQKDPNLSINSPLPWCQTPKAVAPIYWSKESCKVKIPKYLYSLRPDGS